MPALGGQAQLAASTGPQYPASPHSYRIRKGGPKALLTGIDQALESSGEAWTDLVALAQGDQPISQAADMMQA